MTSIHSFIYLFYKHSYKPAYARLCSSSEQGNKLPHPTKQVCHVGETKKTKATYRGFPDGPVVKNPPLQLLEKMLDTVSVFFSLLRLES